MGHEGPHTAEVFVGLLVAVTALVWLAGRLRVPYPILLTLGGLCIALVPGLPEVPLRPDVVFLLILPPILYSAGLNTTWRDFRANLRPITLLAVGLVLATTVAVAVVAHALLGLPWAAAFALGAIVSPPDAVAATTIMERLRIPKRIVTVLEGESLVNDATALVAYRFAVAAALTGTFSAGDAAVRFAVVAVGGVLIGLAVGALIAWARGRLRDAGVDTLVSIATPFVAYLPAEWAGASGVLAAVAAGLYIGRRLPRIVSSQQRLRLRAVWDAMVFLLNGFVFVLMGLQLPGVVERLGDEGTGGHAGAPAASVPTIALAGLAVAGVAIAVRFAWVFPATVLPRLLSRRLRAADPMPPWQPTFLVAWTGLRGIVSLAAAMALPTTFPGRDAIVFVTFIVILVTLVGQGLTLPLVIRRLRLAADDAEERELALARRELAYAALARLETLEMTGEAPTAVVEEVRVGYEARVRRLSQQLEASDGDANGGPSVDPCDTVAEAEAVALEAERLVLIKLRDDGHISDEVLRHIQEELDLAELRLASQRRASGESAHRPQGNGEPAGLAADMGR